MQMRLAVDKVGGYATDYLADVLRTFVWAFPHQYRPEAAAGTRVALGLGSGGSGRSPVTAPAAGSSTTALLCDLQRVCRRPTRQAGAG